MHNHTQRLAMLAVLLFSGCGPTARQTEQAISGSMRASKKIEVTFYDLGDGSPPQSFVIDDEAAISELVNAFHVTSTYRGPPVPGLACFFHAEIRLGTDSGFTFLGSEDDMCFYPDLHLDRSFPRGYYYGKIDEAFGHILKRCLG